MPKEKLTAARRKPRSGPAKRKRRSADDLLTRIVRAAAGEFRRNGFAGATTAAIARKADVTEAQLFRYFGSKSNLFRETIFKPLDQHFLAFVRKHMPDGGAPAGLSAITALYTSELQEFLRANAGMLRSVIAQVYESGAAQDIGSIPSLGAYFDHGAAMMAKTMKEAPSVDPRLIVRISFVAVLACVLFRDWIFPAWARAEDIENAINDFIMEGAGTRSREA